MGLFDKLRGKRGGGRKANEIELEKLKDEVRNLTERARVKKREYDREKSKHLKGIIAEELSLILDELDARKDRRDIIAHNLRQAALTDRKRKEAEAARKHGVTGEEMDEVAVDYEDAVEERKDADRAAAELEKMSYRPEREETADLDARMAEMEIGAEPETGEREADSGLSEKDMQRLKELDLDEE